MQVTKIQNPVNMKVGNPGHTINLSKLGERTFLLKGKLNSLRNINPQAHKFFRDMKRCTLQNPLTVEVPISVSDVKSESDVLFATIKELYNIEIKNIYADETTNESLRDDQFMKKFIRLPIGSFAPEIQPEGFLVKNLESAFGYNIGAMFNETEKGINLYLFKINPYPEHASNKILQMLLEKLS